MPDLTQNALASLAASGAPDREIVAALGRKMTGEEKALIDRTRLAVRLRKAAAKRAEQTKPRDIAAAVQDGRSARSELDIWRARRIQREEYIAMGELVWRDQVESATAMLWEMVGNDLRHTLPGEIADRMPNAGTANAARVAAREAVETIIASWKKAGAGINEECGPTGADTQPENVTRKNRRAVKPR